MASFPPYEDTWGFWNKNKIMHPKKGNVQTDGPPEHCTAKEGSWPWAPLSPSWKLELQKGTPGWVRPCTSPPSLPFHLRGRKAGVCSKREPNKYPRFIMGEKTLESAIRGICLPIRLLAQVENGHNHFWRGDYPMFPRNWWWANQCGSLILKKWKWGHPGIN
jgi:hypothetical protein